MKLINNSIGNFTNLLYKMVILCLFIGVAWMFVDITSKLREHKKGNYTVIHKHGLSSDVYEAQGLPFCSRNHVEFVTPTGNTVIIYGDISIVKNSDGK